MQLFCRRLRLFRRRWFAVCVLSVPAVLVWVQLQRWRRCSRLPCGGSCSGGRASGSNGGFALPHALVVAAAGVGLAGLFCFANFARFAVGVSLRLTRGLPVKCFPLGFLVKIAIFGVPVPGRLLAV